MDSDWVKIAAIFSIALLEAVALVKGIDGALLSMAVAVIAGLAGYQVGKVSS